MKLLANQETDTCQTTDDTSQHEQCCNNEQVLPSKRYNLSFEYVPLKTRPHYDNSEEKLVGIN